MTWIHSLRQCCKHRIISYPPADLFGLTKNPATSTTQYVLGFFMPFYRTDEDAGAFSPFFKENFSKIPNTS